MSDQGRSLGNIKLVLVDSISCRRVIRLFGYDIKLYIECVDSITYKGILSLLGYDIKLYIEYINSVSYRGIRPPQKGLSYVWYFIGSEDKEPVLEILGMLIIPSLPLFLGSHWLKVTLSVWIQSIGQINPFKSCLFTTKNNWQKITLWENIWEKFLQTNNFNLKIFSLQFFSLCQWREKKQNKRLSTWKKSEKVQAETLSEIKTSSKSFFLIIELFHWSMFSYLNNSLKFNYPFQNDGKM